MSKPAGDMPGVLVLGAESQGLGIVRQLGEAGIPSHTVDQDGFGIAKYSKYSGGFTRSPSYSDEAAFTDFLLDLAGKESIEGWTVFPTDDEQVRVLSRNRDVLNECYRIWTQEWEKTSFLYRKDLFYRHLEKLGIPHPDTLQIESLEQLDCSSLDYPVIVKPCFKKLFYAEFRKKAVQCNDARELAGFLQKAGKVMPLDQLLIQERIPGHGENQFSYAALLKDGVPLFQMTAQRVRQHPMDFGHASTYVRLVDLEELVEPSLTLLRSIGYTGVCEVEYMFDERKSEYRMLEVNPRFWGWHTLTRACGVNLPLMLYNLVYGLDQPEIVKLPERAEWVKTITDIPVCTGLMLGGKLSPFRFAGQHFRADENATFWLKDPLPFLAEWVLIPYLWLKRGY